MPFPFGALAPAWVPHDGQRAFLEADAQFKVLACGRRWGKTDACAAEIVASLLEPNPSRHILIAPTLEQARILFERVLELLERLAPTPEFAPLAASLEARRSPHPRARIGDHRLAARSGGLGRSLRGEGATHLVIDEAAFVPEELVTEVAMPMLATTDGRMTLISTPRGLNHFWRFFQLGREGRHGLWSRQAPSRESPHVSARYLALQRELISERAFRTEYEAEFIETEGRVFRTEAIDAALCPRISEPPEPPFVIGIDWGRYHDATALAIVCGTRESARVVEVHRILATGWHAQVDRVAATLRRFSECVAVCDATGVGDPLVDMLRLAAPFASIRGETLTSRSKPALVDNLAWMFENRAIRMEPHPDLLRELHHFEARNSSSGSVRQEAAAGFHDDLVMALALACGALPRGARPAVLVSEPRAIRFSRPRS